MKKWAIAVIALAALDILTTHFSLNMGAMEANPFFYGKGFEIVSLIKMGISIALVGVLARFRFKDILIFLTGANASIVVANLMAIWRLKTL
jgi:hypothetical protein